MCRVCDSVWYLTVVWTHCPLGATARGVLCFCSSVPWYLLLLVVVCRVSDSCLVPPISWAMVGGNRRSGEQVEALSCSDTDKWILGEGENDRE